MIKMNNKANDMPKRHTETVHRFVLCRNAIKIIEPIG